MVSHHQAILAVPCVPIVKPAGFVIDLVGARTRVEYFDGLPAQGASPFEQAEVVPAPPAVGEAYFEWIDVLESVLDARGRYVICELGAGWGRWCVRAICALRQLNAMPFRCIAAEAEPQHFRWMREHFADNGIDPAEHDLRWAAVAATSGAVPFAIGDPSGWYGQSITADALPTLTTRERQRLSVRGLLGRPPVSGNGRDVIWVPAVTLWDLLGDEPRVDLLDLDVQGAEQQILESAAPLLDARVRRVHIGTHSPEIEDGLRRLFRRMGWRPLTDYSAQSSAETPFGTVSFVDGIQSWLNPRLTDSVRRTQPMQSRPSATPVAAPQHSAIDLMQPYGTSDRGFQRKNIFADHLRLLGPASRVVLDVGAHHGDELPTYLSMFPDATVYAIEPTPDSVAILRAGFDGHPRVRIHDIALAESDGTATLHAYDISVRNALTPYSPEPALGRAPDTPSMLVPVQTWTLDRFCEEHAIDEIDLLKLDTQGAEGRVLAGASRLLRERRIRLISLEVLFVPLFEQQADADELVTTLRHAGYYLYDWYNFAYNDRGQVLFGDAIFVRDRPQEPIAAPPPPAEAAREPNADARHPEPAPSGADPGSDAGPAAAQADRIRGLKARVAELRGRLRTRDERITELKAALKSRKR